MNEKPTAEAASELNNGLGVPPFPDEHEQKLIQYLARAEHAERELDRCRKALETIRDVEFRVGWHDYVVRLAHAALDA